MYINEKRTLPSENDNARMGVLFFYAKYSKNRFALHIGERLEQPAGTFSYI